MRRLTPLTAALALLCLPTIASAAPPLRDVRVTSDRAPDATSLKAMVASVTRGCTTDDERAIAIYNYGRYAYYHHAYPSEEADIGALKMLNVYGWSLCGGQHTVLAALYEAAGYKWRYRGWSDPGHTTVEVFYGGRWHYLDTFLKFYAWMPDPADPARRTIAGQDDLKADPTLITGQFVTDYARKVAYHKSNAFNFYGAKLNAAAPAFLTCGDDLPGVLSGIKSNSHAGSPRGWSGIRFDEPTYSTAVDLRPGYALTLDWGKVEGAYYFRGRETPPQHTCGGKEFRNSADIGPILEPYAALDAGKRTWANGTLTFKPDLRTESFFADVAKADNVTVADGAVRPKDATRPGVLTVEMASPYVVARAAATVAGAGVTAEVSADGTKWEAAGLDKLGAVVAGKYRYFVRLSFTGPVTALEVTSTVQHNRSALPYLAPGKNVITVTAADAAALQGNRLAVTYAYLPGSRSATAEKVFDEGGLVADGSHATWSETPVVVQTIVEKLPATLEILVPTPTGKQPVYPKMLFVRREVLAPGQAPAATPAAPTTPRVGAGQTLATVPNPWTLGTTPPAAGPQRPTQTVTLTPSKVGYASAEGESAAQHAVRWPKDGKGAWVLLAAFEPATLPDLARFVSAKLVVNVTDAHDKAATQAAAVLLTAPFAPGEKFDFKGLGQTVGTATVAQGDGKAFAPARRVELDATAAVRSWIRGKKADGVAVRVVPNRGIDQGWTVRFTADAERPVELLITTTVGD